jgi:hypothetical protein
MTFRILSSLFLISQLWWISTTHAAEILWSFDTGG